ncbi:MAG: RluA family pseudouridine synthase [Defluviitaleaceae bacterium]|nr:RluA family pseudouridine synthase [Defluviitaleaceae bacterium]
MKLVVPPEADGFRADVFLTNFSAEISSRSMAQKILINQEIPKNHRVKTGDILEFEIPKPLPLEATPEEIPLNIIHEDSDLIIIDKPRGLVVHPAAGHHSGTLVNALLHHSELSGIGGTLRPGIVHRLDKDTSGLMVVAKNDASHLNLAKQLESREMGRTYNALCIGKIKKPRLRIDLPIGRHPRDRKKMAVITNQNSRARTAATNIEVLEHINNFTLVAAHLETGRTHQIRVHMAYIGNPVAGDTTYGILKQQPPFHQGGQILHATNLSFTHPTTNKEMHFSSPLPDYFTEALNCIKLQK